MELTDMFKECLYALNNLAEPNRAEIAMCIFTAISIFFTIKILNKQTSISKKQTEIMEQQNKIALFDKRYGVYANLQSMVAVISLIVDYKDSLDYTVLTQIVDIANKANKCSDYGEFHMNMKTYMPKIGILFPDLDSERTLILLDKCEELLLEAWKKQEAYTDKGDNYSLVLSDAHKVFVETLENEKEAYLEFISEIESQLKL